MRYEDASHTGAFQGSQPIANDDLDSIPAGSRTPATGNLISGEGTQTGSAGADVAPGAHVAAIAGKGGEDTSFAGGKLSVSGEHGRLSVDAEGNYVYQANAGVENVRDRFTYTLADNNGATDTGALIVEIGKTPVVIKANAQQIVPGPDGVVTLPPGVELSDIMVVGRNLVINMPDGTQLIIIDGAIFVPQLVLGGVEVPSTNLAALLIGQEPQPAAGEAPQSSGGNFADPVPPLDPGVPLGDLIPPTDYDYTPPEPEEVFDILDRDPEIQIQPDGQPASVAAVDSVDEDGLPERNEGEPEGSDEGADGNPSNNSDTDETTGGNILYNSPDGVASITINGVVVSSVGQVINGEYGTLTITSIADGQIGYSYTLVDNIDHSDAVPDHDDFLVVLTDDDGDQASATLTIDIVDDVPTARPDTDALSLGEFVATGNVMTDAAAGDVGDTDTNAADTVGADDASLTSVSGFGGSDSTFNEGGNLVVNGQYGVLTIDAAGNYTYVRGENTPGGVTDVFNYTLTDGDGDTSTTTLTITIPDAFPTLPDPTLIRLDDDVIPDAGGNPDGPGDDDPDVVGENSVNGQLAGTGGDGDLDYAFTGTNTLPAGFTVNVVNSGQVQILQGGTVVMTVTLNTETGAFTVVQNAPIDHPSLDGLAGDNTENNLDFSIGVQVVDADGDVEPAAITINVDDDTPIVLTQVQLGGTVDEDGVLEGAADGGDGDGNPGGVEDVPGEDTVVEGNVSALFSAGADQPLTFSLLSDTSGLPALTSNGAPVTYVVEGNTLTASANGQPVFTLTVNGTTGEYTFTLLDQLDHPSLDGLPGDDTENPPASDLTLALGSIIQATDADGDSVTAPANGLVVTVDDDSPEPFEECPDDVITVNQVGSTFTGNLNLPPVGADEPGVVSFVVEDGDPVLDNEGNPVTSDGAELFYFINDAGVLEARAGDATGDVIFTITINGDGTFTYDQLGVIGEGGGFTFDDLTSTSAGNVEFRGVGADDPATTVDLVLSGTVGGVDSSVNTDSDSIGTANQSMDVGETVRIDLVSDLTSGAGTPSGFGYSGHVSSTSFVGLIPQVQGDQGQTVAFTVWALDSSNTDAAEPDRNPAGGFSDSTITAVTEVTVSDFLTGESTTVDVTGFVVGVFTPVAYGISARVNADGSVTFSGVQQGDSYGFSTGAGEFNAVVVQSEAAGTGGSTQDSFDLGVFSIGVDNVFEPVGLTVPIALTDSDGDAVVCDIDINIGAPLETTDITVTVNEAGLPLIGSDAASDSETQGGDLQGQVTGGTGPYTFALAPGESADGAFGTLTLNPNGTFSYTLDTPFDTQPDADDGTNPELGAESFQVVATDSLGATQTVTINVNIIDDVPTAVDDTDSIAAGQFGPATGNVLTDAAAGDAGDSDAGADTKGADGAVVVGVAAGDTNADLDNPATLGVVIQGTYGKLTLNPDGSYSYVRDAGTDGGVSDVFTYTLEDGDGDRSNATLTITIADAPVTLDAPDEGEAGTVVDEKGLPTRPGEPEGSGEQAAAGVNGDPSETTAGVISFTAPDGPAIVRIDGVVVTGAVGQEFAGSHGTLTITSYNAGTGQIGYSYTLEDNTSGDATFDDFAIQVEDQDGDIANDTLVVDIIDDVPTANNDVDAVIGGFDPATGNVLTGTEVAVGEDANGTDGVADVTGADGGRITDIDHAASPAEAVPNGGSTDIQGTYGVLTIYSNGDYSYQRDPGTPGGVEDVFTYTLTDGDGDTDTATLTIGIDDNFPTLPDPALIRLDDDVIPAAGGNLDGPGDDNPDTVPGNVVNGQLNGSGGDGTLTYAFTGVNGLPLGFSTNPVDADTLQILQGVTVVMTIDLDTTDGSFTVTQNNPILHPADDLGPEDDIENNLDFSIGVEVEDADGDAEPAAITINVDDDTPTINVTKGDDANVSLTTDDAQTIGGASDTAVSSANFGGVFGLTQSIGADGGAAGTLAFALGVSAQGVNSGLESHNADIHLYLMGDTVVGSTSATEGGVDASNTVFDVTVSATGEVTLTQYQQIDHDTVDPTPGGTPFVDHIVSLTDGLVTLTASSSITDNDGDSVSDSETVNIGANLHFTDDGPTASVNTGAPADTIVLDETRPVTTDTPGGTAPNGVISATANFADNFAVVTNFGADGPGTAAYSLFLSANGIASGLFALDSSDISTGDLDGYGQGASITLSINGAGTEITGSAGGTDYFTISIDPSSGIVTFTQINPIWHPTAPNNFDEAATLSTAAATNVQVVQTVTDFDGDTASASINVGQGVFSIQDDGPQAIQPDPAALENEAGATVTADLDDDGEVITDFGEDGQGLVQFANIGPDGHPSGLTSNDDPIEYWLSNNGQTLQARTNSTNGTDGELIFTVQINQATGDYTVTMVGTVDNGAGVTFDNLTSSKAGNVDVRGVGADDPDTAVDLLLTASANGANATINTDSDSIGSANQSMDQGETVRIDFVTNLEDDPTDNLAALPSGFSYDGHVGTQSFLQTIPQVQGAQTETVAFRVYALNTTVTDAGSPDDDPNGAGDGFADASIVQVTHVTVDGFDDGPDDGTPNQPAVTVAIGAVGVWTTIAYGVSAQLQADGSVIFTGIQQGDQYGIETGTDFNAVAVTSLPAGVGPVGGQSSTNSFDLGIFSIGRVDTGDPIDISFDLQITDADGDTVALPGAIDITLQPATESLAAAPRTVQEEQVQKIAANSNTLTVAAAVAAAGVVEAQAAAAPAHDNGARHQGSEMAEFGSHRAVARAVESDGEARSALSNETREAANDSAPASSSSLRSAEASSDHALDNSAAQADAQSSSVPTANDQGPASSSVEASPAALAVGMPSVEALQAAGVAGNAQHEGSVEQIVADALGQGNATTVVDALLNALPGGNGAVGALANVASPAANAVPGGDMPVHGAFAHGADMIFNVHAAMQHHDAVQPVANG